MDQEQAEEQGNLRDLQEEQSRLRSLVEHPGYKYLLEVLEAQVKTRTDAIILKSLPSIDATLEQEYQKGEAAGINFAANFALIRLGTISEEIESLLKSKEGEGHENENAVE